MGRFARLGRLAADVEGLAACVRPADVLRGTLHVCCHEEGP
jgi:hypothetical protein